MMTLLKLNLRALFARLIKRSNKTDKRGPVVKVLIILFAIYIISSFFFMFGTMFYQMIGPLYADGYGWLYFAIMGITVFALCFVGSIFAAQTQLFNAKDNDLLLSLPIRPSSILVSRLASLLALDYLFASFIVIPGFVIWCISQPVSFVGIVFFWLSALILPLASLAFACLFAWLIALITSRMRRKNIITMILSLGFLALYLLFFTNVQNYIVRLTQNGAEIGEAIRSAAFPFYHYALAIAEGRFVSFLIFAICAIAPFAIAVALLSSNFIKIATTNRGALKIKYTEKTLKASSARSAFVYKELRHFISNPMYILNSAIGAVFMLIGAVILAIKPDLIFNVLSQITGVGINIAPATFIITALSGIAAFNIVSAPSISLEGKNLWIAQSLPVRTFDVLSAKVLMHVIVCGVPTLVSSLICAAALSVTLLQLVLIVVVPLLFTIFIGLVGVIINLQFPKFDWINEIQPIKQGIATLLTMFGAAAVVAALVVIYAFLLSGVMTVETYMLLVAALLIVLSAVFVGHLEKGGSRRFETLDN